MLNLSVVIPIYQGASRIENLLNKIHEQLNIAKFSWEVIVVDNNSTDGLQEVIDSYDLFSLRYYLETRQGATFARMKGVEESNGRIIAFLDDDNLPATNWFDEVYEFSLTTDAAAFAGRCHPIYQVTPSPNIHRVEKFLAICEQEELVYVPNSLRLPPSAGLVVTRDAFIASMPTNPRLQGSAMQRGDDYELLLHIHKKGYKIKFNPRMEIYHIIPSFRLERDYLIRLGHAYGICTFELLKINAAKYLVPFLFMKLMLGSFKRLITHIFIHKSLIFKDVVLRCELQFYFATMISPFFQN